MNMDGDQRVSSHSKSIIGSDNNKSVAGDAISAAKAEQRVKSLESARDNKSGSGMLKGLESAWSQARRNLSLNYDGAVAKDDIIPTGSSELDAVSDRLPESNGSDGCISLTAKDYNQLMNDQMFTSKDGDDIVKTNQIRKRKIETVIKMIKQAGVHSINRVAEAPRLVKGEMSKTASSVESADKGREGLMVRMLNQNLGNMLQETYALQL